MQRLSGKTADAFSAAHPLRELFSNPPAKAQLVRFQKGEVVYWEGGAPDRFYYIAEGCLSLGANGLDGQHAVFCIISAPAFFGELELLHVQAAASEVVAFTNCVGYCFHTNEIRNRFETDPLFSQFLCRYLARRTQRLSWKLMRMQTVPLIARLAEYILETENCGLYSCTDKEAAAYLGASKRRVAGLMDKLRREGLLEKHGRRDKITNRAGLQKTGLLDP